MLSTPINPPIISTRRLLITRPMPVPSSALFSWPRRLKGWNNCSSISGGSPAPLSLTLMRMRSGVLIAQSTATVPFGWLYLIAFESRLMSTCFTRVRSASTKQGVSKLGNVMLDAALLALRLDHGLALRHHFGERGRLERQRQLARLDLRQIQNFVDQLQQIPAGVQNLIDAGGLRSRGRRRPRSS